MIRTDSTRGRLALMVAHCAGMLDSAALPVWIGTLIARYGLDSQQAGLLATLFLGGVVLASLALAPQFERLNGRWVATLGFIASALGFIVGTLLNDFVTLALMHAVCGVATGAALSVTHGTIALSARPHRLFALVNTAFGVVAVFYLGATPKIVAAFGGQALFMVFGVVMALAAVVCLLAFPSPDAVPVRAHASVRTRMPSVVWFGIAGVAFLALVQAMTFSFVERIGIDRGFGVATVSGVLIALGLVNLLPAPLAALCEKRLHARIVLLVTPLVQATLAMTITNTVHPLLYGAAASVFVAVVIFAHTFAFGLLARLEPTGRALAATPAMLMTGAAIGPVLGGTLVKAYGYGSVGIAASLFGATAIVCFSRLPRDAVAVPAATPEPAPTPAPAPASASARV